MAAKLAIDGGERTVPEGLVKTWPVTTDQDRQAVLRVFDNDQFHTNRAPFAQELQEKWAAYCGVKHCLVTNGGTGALHMALASAGVRAGDEVITSAFSYWATAASILHQNAVPVFVDVDPQTTTIDPAKIEEKITERTTALLPVHIDGMPVDMDPVMDIAARHQLVVVSDCCQAHGAQYKGRRVGSIADVGGFSLNRSKNLTGGEGGLVTTDNDLYIERAEAMLSFRNVASEEEEDALFSGLGFNYRPHEFINAFVVSQFSKFEERNGQRKQMARYLTSALGEISGVEGPQVPDYADPVYFSYMFEVRPDQLGLDVSPKHLRAGLIKALVPEGVPARAAQAVPVPGLDVFQAKAGYGYGCPWTCRHGRDVEYRSEDYPVAQGICDSRGYVGGVNAANDMELMKLYTDGLSKVLGNVDRLLELAAEE